MYITVTRYTYKNADFLSESRPNILQSLGMVLRYLIYLHAALGILTYNNITYIVSLLILININISDKPTKITEKLTTLAYRSQNLIVRWETMM